VGLFLFVAITVLVRVITGRWLLGLLLLLLLAQALQFLQQLLRSLYLLLWLLPRRLNLLGGHGWRRSRLLLDLRLSRDIVVFVIRVGRWHVLPSHSLISGATNCGSRSMRAEHNALHAALIVNRAHKDEVIPRSAQY